MTKRIIGILISLVLMLLLPFAMGLTAMAEDAAQTAVLTGGSGYTVEFTYNGAQYVLQGNQSAPLTEVLAYIGLDGEITDASVSAPELFSVSNAGGEWIVTARQPFTSEEWLRVTVGGREHEIVVTDDIVGLEWDDIDWEVYANMQKGWIYFLYPVADRAIKFYPPPKIVSVEYKEEFWTKSPALRAKQPKPSLSEK